MTTTQTTELQLKRYKCHKEVGSLKIEKVARGLGHDYGLLYFADGQKLQVSPTFMRKHQPEAGGYYVRYDDGYESFSPAKAFEDGYTEIGA